jgi:hypothetical protein
MRFETWTLKFVRFEVPPVRVDGTFGDDYEPIMYPRLCVGHVRFCVVSSGLRLLVFG